MSNINESHIETLSIEIQTLIDEALKSLRSDLQSTNSQSTDLVKYLTGLPLNVHGIAFAELLYVECRHFHNLALPIDFVAIKKSYPQFIDKISQVENRLTKTKEEDSRTQSIVDRSTNGTDPKLDSRPIALSPETRCLGHFELIELVGEGGFGEVWLAEDKNLGRRVAIKIPSRPMGSIQVVERFIREAKAAAQVTHPNIVAVYEVSRHGSTPFLVSEFVDGQSLKEWLVHNAPSFEESAKLVLTICEAIHQAHLAGVIHRDIKPSNIMIDKEARPLVMDFGLAKQDSQHDDFTLEGQILGTPAYMSPEQAKGESRFADRRCDVYSLGVLLYELMTKTVPFRGNSTELLNQIISKEPAAPRKLNPNIPRDLEVICLRCMEKEPGDRLETALALADELRRFLRGEPIKSRPVGAVTLISKWAARNPFWALLLFVALSIAIVAPIIAYNQFRLARQASTNAENFATANAHLIKTVDELDRRGEDLSRKNRLLVSQSIANSASQVGDQDAELGLALAIEACRVLDRTDPIPARVLQTLYEQNRLVPGTEKVVIDDVVGFHKIDADRFAYVRSSPDREYSYEIVSGFHGFVIDETLYFNQFLGADVSPDNRWFAQIIEVDNELHMFDLSSSNRTSVAVFDTIPQDLASLRFLDDKLLTYENRVYQYSEQLGWTEYSLEGYDSISSYSNSILIARSSTGAYDLFEIEVNSIEKVSGPFGFARIDPSGKWVAAIGIDVASQLSGGLERSGDLNVYAIDEWSKPVLTLTNKLGSAGRDLGRFTGTRFIADSLLFLDSPNGTTQLWRLGHSPELVLQSEARAIAVESLSEHEISVRQFDDNGELSTEVWNIHEDEPQIIFRVPGRANFDLSRNLAVSVQHQGIFEYSSLTIWRIENNEFKQLHRLRTNSRDVKEAYFDQDDRWIAYRAEGNHLANPEFLVEISTGRQVRPPRTNRGVNHDRLRPFSGNPAVPHSASLEDSYSQSRFSRNGELMLFPNGSIWIVSEERWRTPYDLGQDWQYKYSDFESNGSLLVETFYRPQPHSNEGNKAFAIWDISESTASEQPHHILYEPVGSLNAAVSRFNSIAATDDGSVFVYSTGSTIKRISLKDEESIQLESIELGRDVYSGIAWINENGNQLAITTREKSRINGGFPSYVDLWTFNERGWNGERLGSAPNVNCPVYRASNNHRFWIPASRNYDLVFDTQDRLTITREPRADLVQGLQTFLASSDWRFVAIVKDKEANQPRKTTIFDANDLSPVAELVGDPFAFGKRIIVTWEWPGGHLHVWRINEDGTTTLVESIRDRRLQMKVPRQTRLALDNRIIDSRDERLVFCGRSDVYVLHLPKDGRGSFVLKIESEFDNLPTAYFLNDDVIFSYTSDDARLSLVGFDRLLEYAEDRLDRELTPEERKLYTDSLSEF